MWAQSKEINSLLKWTCAVLRQHTKTQYAHSGIACDLSARLPSSTLNRQNLLGSDNMYMPLCRYQDSYHKIMKGRKTKALNRNDQIVWVAQQWMKWSKVHHFKWRAGVLNNLRQRSSRDSGNCILGVNEVCSVNWKPWYRSRTVVSLWEMWGEWCIENMRLQYWYIMLFWYKWRCLSMPNSCPVFGLSRNKLPQCLRVAAMGAHS
jgi:hypothetical protein